MRRRITVVVAAVVALALPGNAALAHECFIANRSDTGNQGAANSQNWFYVTIAEGFQFEFGLEGDELDAAVTLAGERGLPESIAIFGRHTIGANPKTHEKTPGAVKNGGNGKGLEHLEAPGGLIDQMIAIYLEVTS